MPVERFRPSRVCSYCILVCCTRNEYSKQNVMVTEIIPNKMKNNCATFHLLPVSDSILDRSRRTNNPLVYQPLGKYFCKYCWKVLEMLINPSVFSPCLRVFSAFSKTAIICLSIIIFYSLQILLSPSSELKLKI